MKVRILNEKAERETEMNLFLDECSDGIMLRSTDEFGDTWNLLRINKDGTVHFYGHLPDKYPLDIDGELLVSKE